MRRIINRNIPTYDKMIVIGTIFLMFKNVEKHIALSEVLSLTSNRVITSPYFLFVLYFFNQQNLLN